MAPIVAYLHKQVFPYIDNWRFVADSEALLTKQVALSLNLLHSLGICVNLKKSHLVPTQEIQFIGARLDSILGRAFLPEDRAHSIWTLVKQVQGHRSSQALVVQQLLRHMAAATAVVSFAKLNMQPLQAIFLCQFKSLLYFQKRWIRIPSRVRQALVWWLRPDHVFQGIPFQQPLPFLVLTKDASLQG